MREDSRANDTVSSGAPDRERLYESFVQLYVRHHDRLFHHIFSLVPNWQDAQDILQKSSVVLWRKFGDFDPRADFLAWAYGVAFFEVLNFLRTARRDRLRLNDQLLRTLADERIQRQEEVDGKIAALNTCLERLRKRDRELMQEAYGGTLSIRQLAAHFEVLPQSLYNRLHRIRRRLMVCVENRLAEQDV